MRRLPTDIFLNNDIVQRIRGTCRISLLPGPGDVTRELEFIVALVRVCDAIPLPPALAHAKGVAGRALDATDSGYGRRLHVRGVLPPGGEAGLRCAATGTVCLVPEATEEGGVGGDAGADEADEGFAAGPDENAGHGPGQVDGVNQVVDGDDAHDGGNADAVGFVRFEPSPPQTVDLQAAQ